MNRLTLLFSALLFCILGHAQNEPLQRFEFKQAAVKKEKTKTSALTPYLYLGPGMGINNYTGLIGGIFEVPIIPHWSAFISGGSGGWGSKLGGGIMFYIRKQEYLGSSFGLGISNAFGVNNLKTDLYIQGVEDPQPVELILYDAPTFNITYQYHIRMGRTSKFVIGTGIAFAMVDSPYDVMIPDNAELADASKLTMKMLQPGGLMVSLAFQFGVGVRK